MKNKFVKQLIVFGVFLCATFSMHNYAYAQKKLTFFNNSSSNVFMSMRFLDTKSAAWITTGWISVLSGKEKIISVQTQEELMYYFILDRKGTEWGGTHNDKDDVQQWIIDKNFRIQNNNKPKGKSARKVWFDALIPEDDGNFVIDIID